MDKLEAELAKTKRELRNWRWFAAVAVVMVAVLVMLAGVPYLMG
jgi:hypothetical protein